MPYNIPNQEWLATPCAHGVGIFYCPDPMCGRPHIMLFDENKKPLAHFVVPDPNPDGSGFFHDLRKAVMQRWPVEEN